MRQHPTNTTPRVAFVLSGGAALGASQAGMLRALIERGITPDLIVGTSIGAWNGLWVSFHPDLAGMDGLDAFWKTVTMMELFGGNVVNVVANLANKRPYLVPDDGMRHVFLRATRSGKFHDDVTFEELPIPMKITASNLMRGETRIFDQGPVAPALFASSAIPGLFPPVMIDGEQYVDGGLLDNTGVSAAVEAGATVIYILSAIYAGALNSPVSNLAELLERTIHVTASQDVYRAIRHFADRAEFVVIEDNSAGRRRSMDFGHAGELITSGYHAANVALDRHEALRAAQMISDKMITAKGRGITTPTIARWLREPAAVTTLRFIARMDLRVRRTAWLFRGKTRRTAPDLDAAELTSNVTGMRIH